MLTITVKDGGGLVTQVLDLAPGTNLMRGFVAEGVEGIHGDCGGCLSCGTCLIQLPPDQMDLVPAAGAEELALLGALHGKSAEEGWRLSCQIEAPAALADLCVIVAEDADVF